jgi:hypothetical protein
MCHCKLSYRFYLALLISGFDRLSLGLSNPTLHMDDVCNKGMELMLF